MKSLAWIAALAFFLMNPGFACGPGEPQYQYGAAELRAAIEGDWALTITPTGGAPVQHTLNIKQATKAPGASASTGRGGLVRAAYACGNRTLVASADACIDSTSMPLVVTVSSGTPPVTATTTGTFNVMSLVFTRGTLYTSAGGVDVRAEIDADGTVFSASPVRVADGTATLRRL
jgi:hypothetical protein